MAFANFSPGFEEREPWDRSLIFVINPERVSIATDHAKIPLDLNLNRRPPHNGSIARVVKEVKRTSSGWIKEASRKLSKFHWQGGYAAFSVSQSNLVSVIRYIENQEEHHRRVTFQDEYRAFLNAYEIEFDELHLGLGHNRNPYRVSKSSSFVYPGFSFLEPWAEISERLRR